MKLFRHIRQYIKYGLLSIFLSPFFLAGNTVNAEDDLMWQIMEPSFNQGTILNVGKNTSTVGKTVFENSIEISMGGKSLFSLSKEGSMVTKVIKILLMITITLSITMILYNGMKYIIEVGNGKDGKSLMKNVAFIVIGILVAIFSVTILNLMRSVPMTLHDELGKGEGQQQDTGAM